MKLERVLVRLRQILLITGGGLVVIGALLLGASFLIDHRSSDLVQVEALDCAASSECGPVSYALENSPLPAEPALLLDAPPPPPKPAPSVQPPRTFQPEVAKTEGATISDTLAITSTALAVNVTDRTVTPTLSISTVVEFSADLVAEDSYTSTDQVHPRAESAAVGQEAGPAAGCPTSSTASFELIAIDGPPTDHPDAAHGDLNLALRGYQLVSEPRQLMFFEGLTDPDAPQLSGLFQPNRAPQISAVYQVNNWLWNSADCGGSGHGCSGGLIDTWKVTLVGLATHPGEPIAIPERNAQIFGGSFKALVLYADERQITLGYTRRDTVAGGYVVHILGVCVDPNLLALYRAQNDANGWRTSGRLPALRNDQIIGLAAGEELKVSIRDNGSFMDPRSGKDWWRGY